MNHWKKLHLLDDDFSLFYQIATSIQEICDLDEMLEAILSKIKQAFRIEGASIVLHDEPNKEFYFLRTAEAEMKDDPFFMKEMRFPDDVGVAGWVMREGQTVVIQNVARDERFFNGLDKKKGFVTRSMICVPLKTRKKFTGVLYALNKIQGQFTEKEAKILEILSTPIAISIENARLYGELKRHADLLEEQNRHLCYKAKERFNKAGIIGNSRPMSQVFSLIDKVMDTPTTVLIQGETGTGKELVARVIHFSGPFKDKPFVAENCGALPENLLESELFGHVRGAFTGAIADKKGLFEIADGGTIFLDEIGEMSPALQVKFLRVLQEGQIRPVGGNRYKKINVRVIACTNRDLEQEVKKGRFRQDLFYRINVFPISLPPLRHRREDIPLLVNHFLGKACKKLKKSRPHVSPGAMELLTSFNWPGNIRQLENEMERALILAGNAHEIIPEHLSPNLRHDLPHEGYISPGSTNLKDVVQQVEARMIRQALAKTGGNRSKAARMLGVTRQGLINKISRYGLAV